MMRRRPRLLGLVASALLGACAGPGGIYEGARQSNDALRTPMERATQPSKPYEDYDRNRPGKGS
jgi:hypothetical protein